jgi:hypothetical protein
MALHTLNRPMLADKRELCSGMVKGGRGFPSVCGMACLAVCADGPLVPIHVARDAPLVESKERLVGMIFQKFFNFDRSDEPVDVALFALERSVFAGQSKSRLRMIEM